MKIKEINNRSRYLLLAGTVILFVLLHSCTQSEKPGSARDNLGEGLPNIILVMADDLGYGDVGYNGNTIVKTPNLDAMASEAIRFDRFYSGAPVCSPTRGSCLTGRHPYRYDIPWAGRHPLPASEITIAEALKTKGYSTGHFGKWHLGGLSKTINQQEFPDGPSPYSPPWENGFDEAFSTEGMVPTYNPYYHVGSAYGNEDFRFVQTEPVDLGQRTDGNVWRERYWTDSGQPVDEWLEGDDSKIIMDVSIDYMERMKEKDSPFLAVIWFHSVHSPIVAGDEHRSMYSELSMEKQHWFGCITAMDDQMGRLRSYLKESGLAENTILWFCSDNGPSYIHEHNSAGPLRGKKADLWEGGIRVPGILEWPAKFPEARVIETPVSTSDFYPTLLAIADIEMDQQPQLDGENILPILESNANRKGPIGFIYPLPSRLQKHETIEEEQFTLIGERYKLISMDDGNSYQLYDLVSDIAETTDLSGTHPEIFAEMQNELLTWIKSCKGENQ